MIHVPDVPQQRAGSPVQTLRRAPGPAYRAFHVGKGYRPMFLSLADLPVRDALPGLRVWVETARLACHGNRPVC